jgi:hypothetical protein
VISEISIDLVGLMVQLLADGVDGRVRQCEWEIIQGRSWFDERVSHAPLPKYTIKFGNAFCC